MSKKYKRILALLIDAFLVGIMESIFLNLIELNLGMEGKFSFFGHDYVYGFSFLFLFYLLYFIFFDLFAKGQTIGKTILKIKSVNQDNLDLSVRWRLLRTFLKMVSIIFWPISALVYIFLDVTLEDTICKTKTINLLGGRRSGNFQ